MRIETGEKMIMLYTNLPRVNIFLGFISDFLTYNFFFPEAFESEWRTSPDLIL